MWAMIMMNILPLGLFLCETFVVFLDVGVVGRDGGLIDTLSGPGIELPVAHGLPG